MTIKHWPAATRPREKLVEHGAECLTDAELLAVLFGTGIPGKNAIELAQRALMHHQSLRGLLTSNLSDFCKVKGLGIARYTSLKAAVELGRRESRLSLVRGAHLHNSEVVEQFLKGHMRHHEHEVFAVLFLDNRYRLLAFETLFHGTIDSATVHARQILKRALHHNAAAVILSHNHPSGVAEPSESDVQMTRRLREALELIDVRVLDHVVVGGSDTCSMAELGYC